jgi:ABC-type multidrug transport system fused ATPase/permease subunit
MTEDVKRELKIFAQYFAIAVLAGLITHVLTIPVPTGTGPTVNAININEVWRNYWPYYRLWLMAFVILSVIKFLIFYIGYRKRANSK